MAISSLRRHNQFLCGPDPVNGDERTITEYGHFRVTADLGRWPLVEGVCAGSQVLCSVLISSLSSPCVSKNLETQGEDANHPLMAAQFSLSKGGLNAPGTVHKFTKLTKSLHKFDKFHINCITVTNCKTISTVFPS